MENLIRLIFIALCVVGMGTIGFAALYELSRSRRGESLLSPHHLRWRMFSATLWILVLASFAFATLFLWPTSFVDPVTKAVTRDAVTGRRFAAVVSGATLLLIIALVLNVYDIILTFQERSKHQVEFLRNLEVLAREETERVQSQKSENEGRIG